MYLHGWSFGYMNVGDVRYNTNAQSLEVYDGNRWIELNTSHASVGLTPDAELALDWATKKRIEELALEQKAKDNPAIADAMFVQRIKAYLKHVLHPCNLHKCRMQSH
jgi:hypothetical protein